MDPITAVALIGLIICIGYLSSLFFKKTKIPDILLLMLLGLILGPFTGIIDTQIMAEVSEFVAAIALIVILFEGGLGLKLYEVLEKSPLAMLIVILGLSFTMLTVGAYMHFILGWSPLTAVLLGAIVGGSSSAIVIPLLDNVENEKLTTVLSLESALTDGIIIVVAFTIMQYLAFSSGGNPSIIIQTIAGTFSVGIVTGLIFGIIWLKGLYMVKGHEYDYMLTLAIPFLLYAGTEALRGSGAIAVLVFGVVLGNAERIGKMLRIDKITPFPRRMRIFQHEITFFVKSFFFVYLGFLISITSLSTIFHGVFILLAIIIARIIAVFLSLLRTEMKDKFLVHVMMPRGLAAAVLASLPLSYGIEHASAFPDYVFMSIIGTTIVASAGLYFYKTNISPDEEEEETDKEKKE